jgi:hypothetical protein
MKAISLWQPYLAGVLHGDGWCTRLTLGLRCKDHDFSLAFCAALTAGFGIKKKPGKDERGYWLIRVGNKSGIFNGLCNYEPNNDKERAVWLSGMFDSEGNANLSKSNMSKRSFNRRIAFYSTNHQTIEISSSYLDRLSIPNIIRETSNSNSHKGSLVVFELRVLRREGFEKFAALIGSSIRRKAEIIAAIPKSYRPAGHHDRAQALGVIARRANRDRKSLCAL